MKDLTIIGGSAAGASAAIYASRRELDFNLISKDIGGWVAKAGDIENYLGFPKIEGIKLADKFEDHLDKYNIKPDLEVEATDIKKEDGIFKIETNKDSYESKTAIVATGANPRHLGVEGEEKLYQNGLSYCTVCDGPLFPDKVVAVIGGANSALESADMMSGIAEKVYLVTKNAEMKGDEVLKKQAMSHDNVEVIYNADTTKILGDDSVKGFEYMQEGEKKTLEVEGIFVHIGLVPNSGFVEDLVETNDYGEIKVDKLTRTNVDGLYGAGDVTNIPFKQISVCVGQGTTATLQSVKHIRGE